MNDLSPAAKAVADAFEEAWRLTPEADPYECCISPVAAALRAAAQLEFIPNMRDKMEVIFSEGWNSYRKELLAIAAELEGSHEA